MDKTQTAQMPVWLSEAQIRELVTSARKAHKELLGIIEGVDSKVGARRETLLTSLADLDTKARLTAVDTSAGKLKADLKAETSKKRTELLRSIAGMNVTARAVVEFWTSPVAVLLRGTIASTKRATVYANLDAAGPAELKSFAGIAMAAKDADLVSAVVSRLHAITPASARPVSPKAVADALVGEFQRQLYS